MSQHSRSIPLTLQADSGTGGPRPWSPRPCSPTVALHNSIGPPSGPGWSSLTYQMFLHEQNPDGSDQSRFCFHLYVEMDPRFCAEPGPL